MAIKRFRKHVNLKLVDIILILNEKESRANNFEQAIFKILFVVSLLFVFSKILLLHRKSQLKIHNILCDFL